MYDSKGIDGGRVEDCLKDLVEKKEIKKSKCYTVSVMPMSLIVV